MVPSARSAMLVSYFSILSMVSRMTFANQVVVSNYIAKIYGPYELKVRRSVLLLEECATEINRAIISNSL